MIRRIELVNFMSHAHTVIEPADGLTVLVGPNNCGKSAVVTALQILCHNDNSTYVTRHNERECSVTVQTDDGHEIEWRRKNNSPRYAIDGLPFDRLGRGGVPDNLHTFLRLPKVVADSNLEFDVHFGEQKSPVFLIDKPGSYAAQFFASSSDAASLVEMQKRHQQKTAEARRDLGQLKIQSTRLDADLAILAVSDAFSNEISTIETQYEWCQQSATLQVLLARDMHAIQESSGLHNHRKNESEILSRLESPPELADMGSLRSLIDQLRQVGHALDLESERAASLSLLQPCPELNDSRPFVELVRELIFTNAALMRAEIECLAAHSLIPPPVLNDTRSLEDSADRMVSVQTDVTLLDSRVAAMLALQSCPILSNESELVDWIGELQRASAALSRAEESHRSLGLLIDIPKLQDAASLALQLKEIKSAIAAVGACEFVLANAEIALKEGELAIRTRAESDRICSACGAALDADRLIAHARSSEKSGPNG